MMDRAAGVPISSRNSSDRTARRSSGKNNVCIESVDEGEHPPLRFQRIDLGEPRLQNGGRRLTEFFQLIRRRLTDDECVAVQIGHEAVERRGIDHGGRAQALANDFDGALGIAREDDERIVRFARAGL